jgi:diguanylate cyclase
VDFPGPLPDMKGMKKWVEKLVQQFDFEWDKDGNHKGGGALPEGMSEERATLLFVIDTFNKHLMEVENHPVRRVRETLDEFSKAILRPGEEGLEKVLFRFRQFFSAYRLDETAYYQKSFEEFRSIVWDLVDQLSEDMSESAKEDHEIRHHLEELKEAVESNSIDYLKSESRKFIDCYVEKQFKREKRASARMKTVRKNLTVVKKQLTEANDAARLDHLTQALNRKSFDEYCRQYLNLAAGSEQPLTLMMLDIDHFKKINDTFGHPIGDFVLKELVKTLKATFHRECDVVARVGGEEFSILLPDFNTEMAMKKAEELMAAVRAQVYVQDQHQIKFTISIGIAQAGTHEEMRGWIKRADLALYNSKNTGRNRATVAPEGLIRVA